MPPMPPTEPIESRGFFQRFGFVLGIVAIAAVVGVVFIGNSLSRKERPAHRMPEVTMVKIVSAPPPPPPPPPVQQTKMEEKMIEQLPVEASEPKPEEHAAPTSADVGTSIKGDGPGDGFGLSGNRGSGLLGGGSGSRASVSKWGWYAGEVQGTVSDALRKNRKTREADFRIEVRVWSDLTGRITKAQLTGTTGDAMLDETIRSEVLANLQLKDAPPEGMPMPIVMRLTARRPD